MASREKVYEALTKENNYAQGWNRPKLGHDPGNDQQWELMDWLVFAEKYLNDAKTAWAGYTPDKRAITCRLLKAASLLVTCLTVHCSESDLEQIAGVSSTNFPIYTKGLKDKEEADKKA